MAKVIGVFNHKGGVGKTTLTYNLACRLAAKRKKVLIVDADPQCNLTSLALSEDVVDAIYTDGQYTLAKALASLGPGTGDIDVREPHVIPEFGLHLLAGDLSLSHFEEVLAREWNGLFKPEERAARLVSALYRIYEAMSARLGLDYILVDLGPSIGPLNQAAILSSDFFIVPSTPDIYSVRAVQSVSTTVRQWADNYAAASSRFVKASFGFRMPVGRPCFIGYVAQKFGIHRQRPAEMFQRWIDKIHKEVENTLVPTLMASDAGPLVAVPARATPRLAELQNYHSLAPASQEAHRPIWALRGNTDINAGHMDKVHACASDYDRVCVTLLARTA